MSSPSESLRSLREALEALPPVSRPEAAERALDRLQRDLLPRTAGSGPYLVAGIVGPNNAGKSALFNSLAGRTLSPSRPTGGCTRRLIGVLHPDLLERLRAEPALSRFPLIERGPEAELEEVTESTESPAELVVVPTAAVPPGLLLIDTPDFDSVVTDNRLASRSLLAVCDLAIVVVTRHTYQNREVVESLRDWLAHGRPWILVYNEAVDDEVVREHARKLASDLGSESQGVFAARLDLAIQTEGAALDPRSVGGVVPEGRSLAEHLFDLEEVSELKSRALEASLAQLHDEVVATAHHLAADADAAADVLGAVETRTAELARRVAAAAMPGGPFIDAFRAVLDRRSHAVTRGLRGGVRKLRLMFETLPARLRGKPSKAPAAAGNLVDVESGELERRFGSFWEELCRDFGPEARDAARWRLAGELARALDQDLAGGDADAARRRSLKTLSEGSPPTDAFRAACEELVEGAIDQRGYDWDIQAGANLATLAPLALAAAVIVKTGGLAFDVGMAGGGALGSYLTEKYSHLLGSGITREAAERWMRLRAAELEPLLLAAVLPTAVVALRSAANEGADRAKELTRLVEDLA